jgi:hypothetical protein
VAKGTKKAVNEEDVRKFFQERLIRSGYSLQTKVEQRLIQDQYNVTKESPYVDHDKAIGRQIDILAQRFIPPFSKKEDEKEYVTQLQLIIECKNLPDHGWILFSAGQQPFFLPEFNSMIQIPATEKSIFKDSVPLIMFSELFACNGYAEFIYDAGKSNDNGVKPRNKSNDRDDNLFEAIMAVTKAARHFKHYSEKEIYPTLRKSYSKLPKMIFLIMYQSVIIFRGHLYRSDIVSREPVLSPLKFAQMQKNYVSGSYNERMGTIHIVSYDHLDEYIQILHKQYFKRADLILSSQEKIKYEIEHAAGFQLS